MKTVFSLSLTTQQLRRNIVLLLTCPREFLFSFRYSATRSVRIIPYDPAVTLIARSLLTKLTFIAPALTIHFVGSAALGVAGMRDIDFIVESMQADIPFYIPIFTGLLGKPVKVKEQFVEWQTKWKGYNLELLLIDPKHPMYDLEMEAYKRLSSNKRKRAMYQKLKAEANGISVREYQRRKLHFYRNTLGISHFPLSKYFAKVGRKMHALASFRTTASVHA